MSYALDKALSNGGLMDDQRLLEREGLLSSSAVKKSRRLVYACGFCASLTSILLGYDVGIMSTAAEYIDMDLELSTVQDEIIRSSLNIIAAFGGLIAGRTADHLGRNRAIAVACLIFLAGSLIMTFSWSFETLLLGRLVTGLGVGCGFVIAPVYIAEITPSDIRGRMVSLTDVCINAGIVFGFIVGFICDEMIESINLKWRIMLGIGIVPPVLIIITLRFLPESPRWLLLKDRVSEARTVLRMITGTDEEADREVISIEEAIQVEKDITTDWGEVLCPKHRSILRPVLLGLGLGFFQQASGSEAAVYYSPTIFAAAGIEGKVLTAIGNIAVGSFKLAGEVVAMFTMDRVGRKPLFLVSSCTCTVLLLMIGLCFRLELDYWMVVGFLVLFMFFFSVGLGAITFVVASEIFPLAVRGKAMALTVFLNRFLSGLVALTFISMSHAITYGGTFFVYAAVSFVSIFFYACILPETKGKTLEQISSEFDSLEFNIQHRHHSSVRLSQTERSSSDSPRHGVRPPLVAPNGQGGGARTKSDSSEEA